MGRERERLWERNRAAGCTVVRRHPGVQPEAGRVYEGYSERTGAPAVLVAPRREGEWGRLPAITVRLSADGEAGCYAVELERVEAGGLPELTLALYRTARALAQVEERPEVAGAVRGHLAARGRRRKLWQSSWRAGLAGALAACVATLFLGAEGWRQESAFAEHARPDWPTSLGEDVILRGPVTTSAPRPKVAIGLELPKKAWPGHKRAPCEAGEKTLKLKDGTETCWFEVVMTAEDCRTKGYEHAGKCYVPIYPPPKVPQAEGR